MAQSKMEWKGLVPQRFEVGRTHLRPENSLASGFKIQQPLGRSEASIKCFQSQNSAQYEPRTCIKTFDKANQNTANEIDPRGKKTYPDFAPTQKPSRPENRHIQVGECQTTIEPRGLRTFADINNRPSDNNYYIEEKLQRKARVLGLEGKRNGYPVASLGDKSYKYPEYSKDFYQAGGLIPGSTVEARRKGPAVEQIKIVPLTKPNWDVRVKMEEEQLDRNVLNEVDQWEQTTLKEGNPNWKDPEQFFKREEEKKQVTAAKDNKGGAKK